MPIDNFGQRVFEGRYYQQRPIEVSRFGGTSRWLPGSYYGTLPLFPLTVYMVSISSFIYIKKK